MNLDGTANLDGSPDGLFDQLLDPDTLRRCIRGCESLKVLPEEGDSARRYATTVRVGVGAIKGRFDAEVAISDIVVPDSYSMSINAKSPVGHISGTADIKLTAGADGTVLNWTADAKVSGIIAAVGQRLLGAAAQKFANDFFFRLREVVSSEG